MALNRDNAIVAVTGGTGFIGGSIVRSLRASGWRVRALARNAVRAQRLAGSGVEIVTGSLADPASLDHLVRGTDAVIHCAGAVRGASEADFREVNVEGVRRLASAVAKSAGSARFLLLSSLAAREPGLSWYAASKRGGEEALAESGSTLRWSIFRPPAVYGPGDRELLPLFQLMARGIAPRAGPADARFSLLYVEDLARAVLCWLRTSERAGDIMTLHDGRESGYTWNDVTTEVGRLTGKRILDLPIPPILLRAVATVNQQLARLTGYSPMLTPGKVHELRHPDWVCDNALIGDRLGWEPRVKFREGLRLTLDAADRRKD